MRENGAVLNGKKMIATQHGIFQGILLSLGICKRESISMDIKQWANLVSQGSAYTIYQALRIGMGYYYIKAKPQGIEKWYMVSGDGSIPKLCNKPKKAILRESVIV